MEICDSFEPFADCHDLAFSSLKNVILLSSSAARLELLKNYGINVIVRPQNAAEDNSRLGNPRYITLKNAIAKTNSFIKDNDLSKVCYPIISADTVISLSNVPEMKKKSTKGLIGSYPIIGKPQNKKDAFNILSYLIDNKFHTVFTSMVLTFASNEGYVSIPETDTAVVEFRDDITQKEIADYIDTNEWEGAAGAYRIQKTGKSLIKRIYGDDTTVAGLSYKSLFSAILKMHKTLCS